MSKDSKQLEKEFERLRDKVDSLSGRKDDGVLLSNNELSSLVTAIHNMVEEKERVNRALVEVTDRMKKLEGMVASMYSNCREASVTERCHYLILTLR
jgi:predicted  nucleic acid-binding Zn-ribbon protein